MIILQTFCDGDFEEKLLCKIQSFIVLQHPVFEKLRFFKKFLYLYMNLYNNACLQKTLIQFISLQQTVHWKTIAMRQTLFVIFRIK